ncbi:MAG: hypothetical protein HUU01_00175 [Saprospiraceae bacterium]|nr:hypothetical protein [Saprospiraceae bacterium]
MSTFNYSFYGEGIMYPPDLAPNISAIQQAGWTSVILSLFHIDANGNIIYNNPMIIQNGTYVGDPAWPGQVAQLKGGSVNTILASIGGWDVSDFSNLKTIYNNNNNSFQGTLLQSNFQVFRTTFPDISIIDMDCENTYDQDSFVAFCEMLIEIGFGITFCPYDLGELDFWTGSLAAIQSNYPGGVKWWNLQCYAGGGGNTQGVLPIWLNAIRKAIPGFNTDGYIQVSDWSRFWNVPEYGPPYWDGDCPQAVQNWISQFNGDASVGGAFIWNLDQILTYESTEQQHPDPQSCGNVGMTDYVNAMKAALGSS